MFSAAPGPRPFQLADEDIEVAGLNLPPEEPDPTLDGRSGGCCCVEVMELALAAVELGAGDVDGAELIEEEIGIEFEEIIGCD